MGYRYPSEHEAETAIPALIEALEDTEPLVRRNASRSLGKIRMKASQVIPVLAKLTKDSNVGVRASAIAAIRDYCWEEGQNREVAKSAAQCLIEKLKDPDPESRCLAAEALRLMGAKSTDLIRTLCEKLVDPEYQVRGVAAAALGDIGPDAKSCLPSLIESYRLTPLPEKAQIGEAILRIDPAALKTLGME
jgi:HEAT repeat protein